MSERINNSLCDINGKQLTVPRLKPSSLTPNLKIFPLRHNDGIWLPSHEEGQWQKMEPMEGKRERGKISL